jgi:hypothetical protein
MGIKEGVKDAEGDPATVFLHFAAPFTKEGHTMTPQIEAIIDQALARLIHLSTVAFSLSVDNAIGVRALPPEYMLKELIQNNSEVTTEARPR